MRNIVLVILIMFIATVTVSAKAEQTDGQTTVRPVVADIDRKMIKLLALHDAQIPAYSAIMQKQRSAVQSLAPHQGMQQAALYEETIVLLKTVLTDRQHALFIAFTSCLIEEARRQNSMPLAME